MARRLAGGGPRTTVGTAASSRRPRNPGGYELVQLTLGTELEPLPMNPNDAVPLGLSEPFQLTFLTETLDPLLVSVPFQTCVTSWPLPRVQETVQPPIALDPLLVTVTSAWKPPLQLLETWYAAEQAACPLPPVDWLLLEDEDEDEEDEEDEDEEDELLPPVLLEEDEEPPVLLMPVTWPLPPSKTTSEQP